jgi:mannitol 2-dehydrogenase
MTRKLALRNFGAMASSASPVYERSALSPGIVHFGVGNFHPSHQAVYLDALFNMS